MQADATLDTGGFQKGENSRDQPTELEAGQWAKLINLIPGEESARPRGGIATSAVIAGANAIDWAFPFRTTKARKLIIAKRYSDLVEIGVTGGIRVIKAGAFPVETAIPAAVRVGDAVLVTSDYASGSIAYAVTEVNGALVAQPANILRAGSTSLELTADAAGPVEYPLRSCRGVACTFVRRTDEASQDVAGRPITTSTWGDAAAESWENIDERAFFEGLDEDGSRGQKITATISGMPEGATHVRFWITQLTEWDTVGSAAAALQVAAGSTRRYLTDIAVSAFSAPVTILLDKTEGQLAGQTHLSDTVGVNEIPPASVLKFHNGLLWATGGQGVGVAGSSFYSYPISGLPSRRLAHFNVSDRVLKTSLSDTERTMGICASRGHLFFIGENDVWILRNGDPANEPEIIAQGMGTTFPRTIVERGQVAFYLSSKGPAVISGESVELIEPFTHAAVWPTPPSGNPSFFDLPKPDRKKVTAWWYQDNLFMSGSSTAGAPLCAALRAKENVNAGPWTLVTAPEAQIALTNFVEFSDNDAYLVCDVPAESGEPTSGAVARFFGKSITDGNGFYFTAEATARALRTDRRRKWRVGEALYMLARARWTDIGQMLLTLRGQWGRVGVLFQYTQRPVTEILQDTDTNNAWREVVLQSLPEGLVGAWFQPGMSKVVRSKFTIDGLEVMLTQRDGHEFEYVSFSPDETIPTLDSGLAIFDDRFNGGNDG